MSRRRKEDGCEFRGVWWHRASSWLLGVRDSGFPSYLDGRKTSRTTAGCKRSCFSLARSVDAPRTPPLCANPVLIVAPRAVLGREGTQALLQARRLAVGEHEQPGGTAMYQKLVVTREFRISIVSITRPGAGISERERGGLSSLAGGARWSVRRVRGLPGFRTSDAASCLYVITWRAEYNITWRRREAARTGRRRVRAPQCLLLRARSPPALV